MRFYVFALFSLVFWLPAFVHAAPKAAIVETAKIKEGYAHSFTQFTGSIHFEENSDISTQIEGLVEDVFFTAGDRVKKGQLLATLDSEILDASMEALQNRHDSLVLKHAQSKKEFDRYQKLLARETISRKLYDDGYYAMESLKSEVREIESELKKLKISKQQKQIKAPFGGVITQKMIQKGQWLNPGSVLANLVSTESVNVLFDVPSKYIANLQHETPYELTLNDKTYHAKLYAAIPLGDSLTRMFPIKFQLNIEQDRFVFDGMEAHVKIPNASKQKILFLPRDAVIKRFNKDVVFVVADNKAKMVAVEIVSYEKSVLGIKSSQLTVGDEVIVKGNERVAPMQPLKIAN